MCTHPILIKNPNLGLGHIGLGFMKDTLDELHLHVGVAFGAVPTWNLDVARYSVLHEAEADVA